MLGKLAGGVCRVNPVGSGQGPVPASCRYDYEPAVFGATGFVSSRSRPFVLY
jgi:hypothetical protein